MDSTTSTTTEWDEYSLFSKRSVSYIEQYIKTNGLDMSIEFNVRILNPKI